MKKYLMIYYDNTWEVMSFPIKSAKIVIDLEQLFDCIEVNDEMIKDVAEYLVGYKHD